jgi:hypothetical protein
MAIIVLAPIALTTFDKETRKKGNGVEGVRGGEKFSELSRQRLLPTNSPTSCSIPLKKTSNNERSCAENAGNALDSRSTLPLQQFIMPVLL